MKKGLYVFLVVMCLAVFSSQAMAECPYEVQDQYVQYRSYLNGYEKFSAGVKVWDEQTGMFPDASSVSIKLYLKITEDSTPIEVPAVFQKNEHWTIFGIYNVEEARFTTKPLVLDIFWTATIDCSGFPGGVLPEGRYIFKVCVDEQYYAEASTYYCGKMDLPAPGCFVEAYNDAAGGLYVNFKAADGFPAEGGMQLKVYAEACYAKGAPSTATVQFRLPGHSGFVYYSRETLDFLRYYGLTGFNITIYTMNNVNTRRAYGDPFFIPFCVSK